MSLLSETLKRGRLDELGVLVDVAEAGSLTATAARLGVPKSTVGRAIRRIEEDLGVALVRRMARGPVLTEPGRLLADLAAPHVAALRDATAAVGRTSSEAYGVLRVTAPADVGSVVLAPLMPGFLARHPRIRPELVHTLRVVDLIREGIDVAVRLTMRARLPASTLIARRLGFGDIAFYASMSYAARRGLPRHPGDLPNHDHVLLFPGESVVYDLKGPKGPVTVRVPGRVSGDDFLFVRGAVVAGVGIGALPWFIANQELAAGAITPVLPEYRLARGSAWVVHAPAKPVPPKVRAFVSYLLEHGTRVFTQP